MISPKTTKQPHQGENRQMDRKGYATAPKNTPKRRKLGAMTISGAEVPPYCFLKPGISPEEAAAAAVRELGSVVEIDPIAILWELRRAAKVATGPAIFTPKCQENPDRPGELPTFPPTPPSNAPMNSGDLGKTIALNGHNHHERDVPHE